MRRPLKMFLLSALLILSAPFGVRRAQREGESNYQTEAAETSLGRVADFRDHIAIDSLEISETSDVTDVARSLQVIPFASHALFLKEYFEIDE